MIPDMPRVSQAHRTARRDQVIDAALVLFTDEGFHATGMADIIRGSGMSAGAVYVYFRSKDDLIEAVVTERVMGEVGATFAALVDSGEPIPLVDALAAAISRIEAFATGGPVDLTRVAVQAWSESLRNERIRGVAQKAYGTVRGYFAVLVRQAQARGEVPADADPDRLAQALFSLVIGYLLQRLVMGDVDAASYHQALRALLRP